MGFYCMRRCELPSKDNLIVVFMLIDKIKEIKIVDVITVAIPGLIIIGFAINMVFTRLKKLMLNGSYHFFHP